MQLFQDFFLDFYYQVGVKSIVFGVLEDLKFKISEDSDQNKNFPGSTLSAVSAKMRQANRAEPGKLFNQTGGFF